jgi:hypothetical protein
LICQNTTFDKLNLLKDKLRDLNNVESVDERSFVNHIAIIDVEMAGNTNMLATKLTEFIEPLIEITGKTQNRIELRFLE